MKLSRRVYERLKHWTLGSLRRQLMWAFGVASLFMLLILGSTRFLYQREFQYEQGLRNASNLAYAMAVSSSSWLIARDMAGLQEVVNGFAQTDDLKFAAIVTRRGEVLASTRSEQIGLLFSDEVSRGLLGAPPRTQVLYSGPGLVDVAVPIMSGNRHTGWARVEMTQDTANHQLQELTWVANMFALGSTLMVIGVSVLLGRRLTRRLDKLIVVAEGVGQGRSALRARVEGADEIAVLAGRFNTMLDLLDAQQADLQVAATAFETQEPVVILDGAHRFMRVNRAFSRTFGYDTHDVQGQAVSLIRSSRHGPAFYDEAWAMVEQQGAWQGEIWYQRKDGEEFPCWVSVTPVHDPQGAISHHVISMIDISARKQAEEEIRQLAYYDPLTELPNRRMLLDHLRHALAAANRTQHLGALLFLDLDNFKAINDTLGHDKGDIMLCEVARRLAATVRGSDMVARLAGDEFVVMLTDLSGESLAAGHEAEVVTDKLLAALREPFDLAGLSHHNSGSIGIALFGKQGVEMEEVLRQADLALHQAKARGRDSYCFFDPAMQAAISERVALERDLRLGLESRQFLLHYQAQVDGAGRMTGAEVLLRWRHPQRGMVSPALFIPLAEESGLIQPLGRWVLEQACQQLARWAGAPQTSGLTLAVNVSVR